MARVAVCSRCRGDAEITNDICPLGEGERGAPLRGACPTCGRVGIADLPAGYRWMSESETKEGRAILRLAEARATALWRRHLARRREAREPVREARGGD